MESRDFDKQEMYKMAIDSYFRCIQRVENIFLHEEAKLDLNIAIIKNEFIRVTYFESDFGQYQIEIRVALFRSNDERIGYYSLYKDQRFNNIDDALVFI